ncbi:MAG: ATP-grasp domain-containing protein, partial [Candidatus Sericytochromatia bacterium]
GVPMLNPPEHLLAQQLKPLELMLAKQVGLETPRTLISNDPAQVQAFVASVAEAVYKPVTGYGVCRPVTERELGNLERLKASPVIFQERVHGTGIRATFVDGQLVSTVRIPSDSLDYRDNPAYVAGQQVYEPTQLPSPVLAACLTYLERAGLLFAGIDLVLTADGHHVFLEANSSPMYLEIEMRTRHPITFELCTALLKYANGPEAYGQARAKGRQLQGFVPYSLPFGPEVWT